MARIFLITALLVFSSNLFAQFEASVSGGVRYNLISISETGKLEGVDLPLFETGSRFGYGLNAAVRRQFENIPIFIQLDGQLSVSNGGFYYITPTLEEKTYIISMTKVSAAIIVGVKIADRVSLYAAPTSGYFFTPKIDNPDYDKIDTDYSVLGWILGIGYDRKHLTLNFRVESIFPEYGYSVISDNHKIPFRYEYRPFEVSLTAGYRFGDFRKKRYVPRYN